MRSLIGRGATSEVYTAEHTLLGDVVAIKLLRPELAEDSAQALALVDEGAKVRAIDHPNVVRVLDAGIDPATHGCYLVMEYVAGEPLSARLRRDAPLPEPTVRRLGAELADGIAAAHARNIIHRDLKPANIMLVHAGDRPKIVDFGIAKHLGAKSAVTTGRMIGTLAYMAPEQLAAGLIAPCTDIWALGVILFEALTARHPFTNFDDGRCAQLFDEPARAASLVPAVSPELDAILARCLARDPARRPASAAELAALLRGERPLDDERITVDAGPVGGSVDARGVDARAAVDARGVEARAELDARGAPSPSPRTRRPGRLAWMTAAAAVVIAAAIYLAVRPGSSTETHAAPTSARGDDAAAASAASADDRASTSRTDGAATSLTDGAAATGTDGAAASGTAGTPAARADARVVEVRSVPRGARVTIDGKPRGVTPLTLQVALPETIVVERAGYRAARVRVEAAGAVDVTLQRERRAGARATSVRKETLD